jgi:hypothetical protein
VDDFDAESLARGILSLIESPSLAAELGECAFKGVRDHYSVGVMACRAIEAFDSSGINAEKARASTIELAR